MKNVIFDDKRRGGGLDGFDVAFYSDIGRRSSQQDSAYLMAGEQAAFAVLCDGMGGARGGQLASASAVDILRAYYAHYLAHGREMQDSAWMREAAEAADNMVHGLRDAGGNPLAPGPRWWPSARSGTTSAGSRWATAGFIYCVRKHWSGPPRTTTI